MTFTPPMPTHITPPHPDTDEGALFWAPRGAQGAHTLTDHGGPKLTSPRLWLLLYGNASQFDPQITAFGRDLMTKGYLSLLQSYGITGTPSYVGSANVPQTYGQNLTQASAFQAIADAIANNAAPQPDGQTIIALILPQGVSISAMGGSSCQSFCGFHSVGNNVLYAVIGDTACTPCHGPESPFNAQCMVLAHEVAETVTDPYGTGWYEDSTGMENADICAWQAVGYGPWTVQPYWTNEGQCTFGAYQSAPPPRVPQPPPPASDLEARVAALEAQLGIIAPAVGALQQTNEKVKQAYG